MSKDLIDSISSFNSVNSVILESNRLGPDFKVITIVEFEDRQATGFETAVLFREKVISQEGTKRFADAGYKHAEVMARISARELTKFEVRKVDTILGDEVKELHAKLLELNNQREIFTKGKS